MKHITFLLLLFSCSISAQVLDTSYTVIRYGYNPDSGDSAYYETLVQVFSDGRTNLSERLIGSAETAIREVFTRAEADGREFAEHANAVWNKPVVIAGILQANTVLTTMFDTSIIQISVDLYGPAMNGTTWDIISTQGNFTGTMTVNPNGNNLRLQIGGTTYALLPVGDSWIRFQNFPNGSYTDLHRLIRRGNSLEFRSADETLIIRKQ